MVHTAGMELSSWYWKLSPPAFPTGMAQGWQIPISAEGNTCFGQPPQNQRVSAPCRAEKHQTLENTTLSIPNTHEQNSFTLSVAQGRDAPSTDPSAGAAGPKALGPAGLAVLASGRGTKASSCPIDPEVRWDRGEHLL